MNLTLLQEYLHPYDECRILGRPFSAGSCAGELIALTRRGEETVRLHILQYDDTYSERLAEADAAEWENPPLPPPVTRRETMLQEREGVSPSLLVEHVKALRWGEVRLETSGSQYGVPPEICPPPSCWPPFFGRGGGQARRWMRRRWSGAPSARSSCAAMSSPICPRARR